MKRLLLLLLLVLGLLSCASQDRPYSVLRHSTFTYPYAEPLQLYIVLEKDRSGGQYFDRLDELDLRTFQERFNQGLQRRKLRIGTFTAAGNPTTVKLANPFRVVIDSTQADLILYLRIDGFEQGSVEVTGDRVLLWNSFGITQYYVGYNRVPASWSPSTPSSRRCAPARYSTASRPGACPWAPRSSRHDPRVEQPGCRPQLQPGRL